MISNILKNRLESYCACNCPAIGGGGGGGGIGNGTGGSGGTATGGSVYYGNYPGNPGGNGTLTAVGSAGLNTYYTPGYSPSTYPYYDGGSGGAMGSSGGTSSQNPAIYGAYPAPGAGGAAVAGNSFVTWLATGTRNGTIS